VLAWTAGLGAVGFALLSALVIYIYVSTPVPTPQQLALAQRSTITFSDGSPLVTLGAQNRKLIPLSQVPLGVRQAVIAAEDHGFYHESGISPRGIARAVFRDLRGGRVLEGGSTITQQYAKNAYLTQDRTFTRKFREIVLAVKLDNTYSKDEILDFYLNTIYFGRGAFGIETAAETYFGVPAAKLSTPQGALLAGLIRGPSLYDPALHPLAAKERYREVVAAMVSAGAVRAGEADALPGTKPVVDAPGGTALRPDLAYLRDAVVVELAAHGISEAAVSRTGLTVRTTIDRKAQEAAWNAASTTLQGAPKDLQVGLSAIDPATGAVRASVGGLVYRPTGEGADVTDNVFGSSVLPGSTFKAVVLAGALRKGYSLASVYSGRSPEELPGTSYVGAQALTNDKGDPPYGNLTLTPALAGSVNTVFVPLGMQVGDDKVASLAHEMGVPQRVKLDAQPSLAIGTSVVRPVDVTSIYATLASGGTRRDAHLVDSVNDPHRHQVYRHSRSDHRVLDSGVVADTTSALQAVVTSGTGSNAALAAGRPVAGKTGTTATSALFAGFTPQLATSVAVFYEDNRPLTGIAGLAEVYGATLPATAFKRFMDAALAGTPVQRFPAPAHVGHAVSDVCPAPPGTTFVAIPGGPSCSRTGSAVPAPSPSRRPSPSPSPTPSATAGTYPSPLPASPSPLQSSAASQPSPSAPAVSVAPRSPSPSPSPFSPSLSPSPSPPSQSPT
jgi:membrane peptidoglycan carboxypeptidase